MGKIVTWNKQGRTTYQGIITFRENMERGGGGGFSTDNNLTDS